MNYLVTGSAGFIGFSLSKQLLENGNNVIGVDNHNNYYDPSLKDSRVKKLQEFSNYIHNRVDLTNSIELSDIFKTYKPTKVINLAAQAGVRYSMENPLAYINSNVVGFANILENCRLHNVEHLVYASTSSVYGANTKMPFSEHDNANHPLSLYAASKKSNELMAHTYSYLYNIPTTGLRFFTVYGPYGRPDMALFKFTKNIIENKSIDVFNHGNHKRDFTFIDDIVLGIQKVIESPPLINVNWNSDNPDPATSKAPWCVYNIGNNKPLKLSDYIGAIELNLEKKAKVNYLPLQLGDVKDTYADMSMMEMKFNYKPNTSILDGVAKFINWYKEYYKL